MLFVTASGTLATYLYDEGSPFAARLCTGACTGIATLGLVGFVLASQLFLTPFSIFLTLLVLSLPFVCLVNQNRREIIKQDLLANYWRFRQALLHPRQAPIGYIVFYLVIIVVFWRAFQRSMIEVPEGIYTGLINNFGDLPFHLSVITSFVFGNNFPPQDPTYAGVHFTYPFLTDFVSAILVRCGASLRESVFIENFVVAVAFVGVVHRWALVMLRDRLAAVMTPILVLLNGGFGWILFFNKATESHDSLMGFFKSLPAFFTCIPETSWRWGNALSALLIPQRGFLLGLPLAVIVFTQWWLAMEGEKGNGEEGNGEIKKATKGGGGKAHKRVRGGVKKGKRQQNTSPTVSLFPSSTFPLSVRRMIAAGVVAGLLPLVHAHSFVVVMAVGGCIALGLFWRAWLPVIGSLFLLNVILGQVSSGVLSVSAGKLFFVAMGIGLATAIWFLLPPAHRVSWYAFFITALIVALPQLWWSTRASAVDSSTFFAFQFGWDSAGERYFDFKLAADQLQTWPRLRSVIERTPDVLWFWLKNSGLFIPLTLVAIFWRDKDRYVTPRRVVLFLVPFSLCFIVPNLMKMAPWIWDNIKVLFFWWLASAPLVALLLARLWKAGNWKRVLALGLFFCVTAAGGLDVATIMLRPGKHQVFDAGGIQFSEFMKQRTSPRALVIHAPVHNHPVFLTGRRSLMGYPGHIWTHGLDYVQRESEIKRVYAGAPDAEAILRKYSVRYAVVGPQEHNLMNVNEPFFSRFELVGEVDGYRLYKITDH